MMIISKKFLNIVKLILLIQFLFTGIFAGTRSVAYAGQPLQDKIKELVSQSEDLQVGRFVWPVGPIYSFYKLRQFSPVWVENDQPNDKALKLKNYFLKNTPLHGLVAQDYWSDLHEKFFSSINNKNSINLEIALTQSLILFASHMQNGRSSPEMYSQSVVKIANKILKDFKKINELVLLPAEQLEVGLESLAPPHRAYKDLYEFNSRLLEARQSGAFGEIRPPEIDLKLGMSHPVLAKLKRRLQVFGYEITNYSERYDDELDRAILAFQTNSQLPIGTGLNSDSRVWINLSFSLDQRISQVQVNMERWRWLPRDLGNYYAFVNTAAATIEVFDKGKTDLRFKTVNGKRDAQTPSMIDLIKRVDLNPEWHPTRSISQRDILPKLKENPKNYLRLAHLRVYHKSCEGCSETLVEDPSLIDWNEYDEESEFPYLFVQEAGSFGALGFFRFPLDYQDARNPIYLHDTNERELFQRSDRHLSHGCIRLEKPFEFAEYILADTNKYSVDKLKELTEDIADNKPREQISVKLKRNLPVYILYLTAGRSPQGAFWLASDAYSWDKDIYHMIKDLRLAGH